MEDFGSNMFAPRALGRRSTNRPKPYDDPKCACADCNGAQHPIQHQHAIHAQPYVQSTNGTQALGFGVVGGLPMSNNPYPALMEPPMLPRQPSTMNMNSGTAPRRDSFEQSMPARTMSRGESMRQVAHPAEPPRRDSFRHSMAHHTMSRGESMGQGVPPAELPRRRESLQQSMPSRSMSHRGSFGHAMSAHEAFPKPTPPPHYPPEPHPVQEYHSPPQVYGAPAASSRRSSMTTMATPMSGQEQARLGMGEPPGLYAATSRRLSSSSSFSRQRDMGGGGGF